MASAHAMTVVKNNCFKAPRISNTELPASRKESPPEYDFCQSSEVSEENFGCPKETKTRTSTVRRHGKSRNKFIQKYEKGESVSEEEFYENLIKLREEHKKTLKLLETKYYDELQKNNSFQWEGFQEGVGLNEIRGRNGWNCMSQTHGQTDQSLENNEGAHPKSLAQDIIKDMSHLNLRNEEQADEDSEDSHEIAEEKKEMINLPEDFSSSLFPKRSASIDRVEHLWKDFSVRDYSIENESLEEQQTAKIHGKEEWTPSITVPKPFTMTLREATKEKRKTRSMQMLEEDMVLKKSLEEAELKKKFRAQPVPATTFLPLYDDIVDKNKQRSEHVRKINKAILKATEKPFSFVKREEMKLHRKEKERRKAAEQKAKEDIQRASFKAKPPPKHMNDLNLADRLAEQDEYRKIRKKLRAAELLASSKLPPSMQARANVTPAAKSRQTKRRQSPTLKTQFRPNINPEVPDFNALHWEFEKELRRRKRERQPTVVEPFNLKTAHIPHAKSGLRRARSMENLSCSVKSPNTRKSRPYSARLSASQDTLPFGTTDSVRLRDSAVKKSLEAEKQRNVETTKARKEKEKREKQLRSQVTLMAKANDHSWQLKKNNEQKLRTFRDSERDRQKEYERELAEMRNRVQQRPLLFERESQLNAKRKAEKKYKQILRDAGVHEYLVDRLVTRKGGIVDSEDSDGSGLDREEQRGIEDDDFEYPTYSGSTDPEEISDKDE